MRIRMDTRALEKGLDRRKMMTEYGLRQAGSMEAKRLAIHAQGHRPWTDRTGAARRGIHGRATFGGSELRITLSGSVNYMVYLEFARKKRWAILWPTIEARGRTAIENIARFMEALKE